MTYYTVNKENGDVDWDPFGGPAVFEDYESASIYLDACEDEGMHIESHGGKMPVECERMDYNRIGKRWEPRNGQARYYINDWKNLIGLHVEYYNTGNVARVYMDGLDGDISNNHFKKYIQNTKVWVGEDDGSIHVDYCENETVKSRIISAVESLIMSEGVA